MNSQDWTVVTVKRHRNKKTLYTHKNKVENKETPMQDIIPLVERQCICHMSLQDLIRKRIAMSLTQEKADRLCGFPEHTFRDMECNRIVPDEIDQDIIQTQLGIQLKIMIAS